MQDVGTDDRLVTLDWLGSADAVWIVAQSEVARPLR